MKQIFGLALLSILFFCGCRQPKDLIYQDVQHISIQQAGMDKTKLAMDIRLYNPNQYSMKLKSGDVDVFINNSHVGKMAVTEFCNIPGNDTATIPVMLEVELKNVLPNVLQIILNNEVDIKVTGTLKAGRHGVYVTIPVSYEGKQPLHL